MRPLSLLCSDYANLRCLPCLYSGPFVESSRTTCQGERRSSDQDGEQRVCKMYEYKEANTARSCRRDGCS